MRIKNTLNYKILEQLFSITRQTWSKWKKEDRKIVNLLETYFNDEMLIEFQNTGKVSKLELLKQIEIHTLDSNLRNLTSFQRRLLIYIISAYKEQCSDESLLYSRKEFIFYIFKNNMLNKIQDIKYFETKNDEESVSNLYKNADKKLNIKNIKDIELNELLNNLTMLSELEVSIILTSPQILKHSPSSGYRLYQ
jgi:hypothetical protein